MDLKQEKIILKVLIAGFTNSGKTAIIRNTFQNIKFTHLEHLKPTRGIERLLYPLNERITFSIWDVGGTINSLNRLFSDFADVIFSELELAFYVASAVETWDIVVKFFKKFMRNIVIYSRNIHNIYILINKIDLEHSSEDIIADSLVEHIPDQLRDTIKIVPLSIKEGSSKRLIIKIFNEIAKLYQK
ncbi:MAG: hypothetical protein GF364_02100 [Candidatus Lokiarchaeota archaeon]|nr:hypothetical protein [Candidatus Lokiarchaeota archaeon]